MTQAKYPSSAANPKDITKAINVANAAEDALKPPGEQLRAVRALNDAFNAAATAAEVEQARGGSGHSKP
jgi:hypothetical protein